MAIVRTVGDEHSGVLAIDVHKSGFSYSAGVLNSQRRNGQHAALDCVPAPDCGGADGCFPSIDPPSVEPSPTGDGSSAGLAAAGASASFPCCDRPDGSVMNLRSLAVLVLMVVGVGYVVYGRQIESVSIKLIDSSQEIADRRIVGMPHSERPDYKIILHGPKEDIETNTQRNSSAANWLTFTGLGSIYLGDIEQIEVIEDGVLLDKSLEIIPRVEKTGKGQLFEYKIRRRWQFFDG